MITITRADIWDEGYSIPLSGKMIEVQHPHEDPGVVMISLNEIRHGIDGNRPCKDGWERLLKALEKTKADDDQFPLEFILDSNDIDDAFWCISRLNPRYKKAQALLICNIAESVLPIFEKDQPGNFYVRRYIEARRNWALGDISDEEWCDAQDVENDVGLAVTRDLKSRRAMVYAAYVPFGNSVCDAAYRAMSAAGADAEFPAVENASWTAMNWRMSMAWYDGKLAEREKQTAMFKDFCNLRGDYKKCIRNENQTILTMG